MSQQDNQTAEMPTGIKLHKGSRYLEINYASGESFNLPYEYLRAFSVDTEENLSGQMGDGISDKPDTAISLINPVGSY